MVAFFPYSDSSRAWDTCFSLPSVSAVAIKTQSPNQTFRNTCTVWTEKGIYSAFHRVGQQTPTRVMAGHAVGKAVERWSVQWVGSQVQQQKIQMQSVCWHTWTATQRMKEQQMFTVLSSPLKITVLITFPSLPTWTASDSQPSLAEVPSASSIHEHT